jgi:putative ABC transport system substrate-binding protein
MELSEKIGKERHRGLCPVLALGTAVLGWLVLCFWMPGSQVALGRQVAVFDFDKRTPFPDALGRYIEQKLTALSADISVVHYSAEGNEVKGVKILSDLDQKGLDLIIVRTSDALIIAQHTIFNTPTLYTNVTNPILLGFRTLGPPGGNISGVSYHIPVENHLSVYKAIMPDMRQPGFLFDRHNQSRKAEVPEARQACADLQLIFDSEFIEKRSQLRQAVERLITRGADAIVASSSNIIYNNVDMFLDITDSVRKPVFSFYKAGVGKGAVAAISSDYFQMADRLLMPMARQILLENVRPGDMPAAFLEQKKLFINTCQAKKLGLEIPFQALMDSHKIEVEAICQ